MSKILRIKNKEQRCLGFPQLYFSAISFHLISRFKDYYYVTIFKIGHMLDRDFCNFDATMAQSFKTLHFMLIHPK